MFQTREPITEMEIVIQVEDTDEEEASTREWRKSTSKNPKNQQLRSMMWHLPPEAIFFQRYKEMSCKICQRVFRSDEILAFHNYEEHNIEPDEDDGGDDEEIIKRRSSRVIVHHLDYREEESSEEDAGDSKEDNVDSNQDEMESIEEEAGDSTEDNVERYQDEKPEGEKQRDSNLQVPALKRGDISAQSSSPLIKKKFKKSIILGNANKNQPEDVNNNKETDFLAEAIEDFMRMWYVVIEDKFCKSIYVCYYDSSFAE